MGLYDMEFSYYLRPVYNYWDMVELAKHADELKLFGAFINDHLIGLFGSEKTKPFHDSFLTLAGISQHTKHIRLGHITLLNNLRNPAHMAKMISTLDNMSNGRFEVILGGGWMKQEYEGYDLMGKGRGLPSAGRRVSMAKESVHIFRGMLNNEHFDYEGRSWKLKDAINIPQPIQKNIRISVGARKPRMMRIAARYCDGVNIQGHLGTIRAALKIIEPALENNGKKLKDYFLTGFEHTLNYVKTDKEYDELAKKMAARGGFGTPRPTTPDYIKDNCFVGNAEALITKFRKAEDLGMKMMIVYLRPADGLVQAKENMSWFKDNVIDQM